MAKVDIVIGSGYGDEGKGIITARLAEKYKNEGKKTLVVLSNGGSQRGHTVVTDIGSHTFKHFGSGTFAGAYTCCDRNFILNPMQFCKESDELAKIDPLLSSKTVYYDSNCLWSTPFDMMANQIIQKQEWTGTCGMGIWETILRNQTVPFLPITSFVAEDFTREQQIKYLKDIKDYYENVRHIKPTAEFAEAWNSNGLITHFISDCTRFVKCYGQSYTTPDKIFNAFDNIIVENGQGLLLSDEGKDDPEKTPSITGIKSTRNILIENADIHYVTRPYLTRHGSNNWQGKKIDCDLNKSSEINVFNEFQHDFLYNDLDLFDLKDRITKDLKKVNKDKFILEVTHCDELDREAEFKKIFKNCNFYGSAKV